MRKRFNKKYVFAKKGTRGDGLEKGEITYPRTSGKFRGVSLGKDKNGIFVMTHRARSKSYEKQDKIPLKDIKFIRSTG